MSAVIAKKEACAVYLIENEAEVEEFDREFPAKEKLKLPGQLW